MSNLQFQFSWQDPGRLQGPELAATYAQFKLLVGDANLTECVDEYSKSIQEDIVVPLYPLAEWFTLNWWSLWHKTFDAKSNSKHYSMRHAGEGFALPDFSLISDHAVISVKARSYYHSPAKIKFLNSIQKPLDLLPDDVKAEVARLIEAVVGRLSEKNIRGTALQQEWEIIEEIEANPNSPQHLFCQYSAQMGLDPFRIESSTAGSIEKAIEFLPGPVQPDFFSEASATGIEPLFDSLSRFYDRPTNIELNLQQAAKYSTSKPWQEGYSLAARFRDFIELDISSKFSSPEDLRDRLGNSFARIDLDTIDAEGVAAAVKHKGNGSHQFVCALKPGRPDSQTFALARATGEIFYEQCQPVPKLLTRSLGRANQKRSRAFAAELLAPASEIKKHLPDRQIEMEDVLTIAEHFQVSSWVVEHQIRNHSLATVIDG
jgi:hypothetical protein